MNDVKKYQATQVYSLVLFINKNNNMVQTTCLRVLKLRFDIDK